MLAASARGDDTSRGATAGVRDSARLADPQQGGACIQAAKDSPGGFLGGNLQSQLKVIEAEALFAGGKVTVNSGSTGIQEMAGFGQGWGRNAQLFWSGGTAGAVLDMTFPVTTEGYYEVFLHLTRAPDFGQVKTQIRGSKPFWIPGSSVDSWGPAIKPPPNSPALTPPVALAKGDNKLSLMISGKNEKSSSYRIGIDCIVLRFVHP